MSTFKSRLHEAIKSVASEIGAMSKQEFRHELSKAMGSDRARSLYHAWNISCPDSSAFSDCCVNWKKVSVTSNRICKVSEVQNDSLFNDEKTVCKKESSGDYERVVSTSDDYFTFRAAA